jgi:DNA repair exonuclease SbcCD ATPase subunit
MTILKRLDLINCQSHVNSTFEFHPGVNVITGLTDAGKSTVLRMLYDWLAKNKPSNLSHAFYGKTKQSVRAVFDDCIIERIRNKHKNKYILNGEPLTGTDSGKHVPEPVEKALNLHSINVIEQGQVPFMLGWTPGARASFLNKATNLEIIDQSTKNALNKLREEQNKLKATQQQIEDCKKEQAEFIDIEAMWERSNEIGILVGEYIDLQASIKLADRLIEAIEDIDSQLKTEIDYDTLLNDIKKLEGLQTKKEKLGNQIAEMDYLIYNWQKNKKEGKVINEQHKKLTKRYNSIKPKICPLCNRPWNRED